MIRSGRGYESSFFFNSETDNVSLYTNAKNKQTKKETKNKQTKEKIRAQTKNKMHPYNSCLAFWHLSPSLEPTVAMVQV